MLTIFDLNLYLFVPSAISSVQSNAWIKNLYSFFFLQSKKSVFSTFFEALRSSITAFPVVWFWMSILNGKSSPKGLKTWYEQIPSVYLYKKVPFIVIFIFSVTSIITYFVGVFHLQIRFEVNANIFFAYRSNKANPVFFNIENWNYSA